jgi:hypothetical protein
MDCIELLKNQHDEVEELFKKYEALTDRAVKGKLELFEKIADRLAAHSEIEEKIFYPGVKTDDTEDMLLESVEEHLSVKRVIADLLEIDATDENFDAKMKVLHELVEHHVEEEEHDLFKKVKKEVAKERLEEMGLQMKELFDELMAEEPREEVPAQTDEAAPIS